MRLFLLFSVLATVNAVVPQLALDFKSLDDLNAPTETFFASHAMFGTYPRMSPEENPSLRVVYPSIDNSLLCRNETRQSDSTDSIFLVPRGECSFETKALHGQMQGAKAVLIYGTLASRYTLNSTEKAEGSKYTKADIIWPVDRMDYDCNKGRALIKESSISLLPLPYNAQVNDPLLMGESESSLCWRNSPDHLANCASKMCLLTGKTLKDETQQPVMEACCAWDLHLWLYADANLASNTSMVPEVAIPVAYVTVGQAQSINKFLHEHPTAEAVLYSRWRPTYNSSAILIWLLGSTVAALAAYMTASEYRQAIVDNAQRPEQGSAGRSSTSNSANRGSEIQAVETNQDSAASPPEEILELTALHAVGFVVMASSSLLILFYFKIYGIVKVFYALGCSTAVAQVILAPSISFVMTVLSMRNSIVWRTNTEDLGDITVRDVFSHIIGYSLGATWLYIAINVHDAESMTFFWVMQDIFGACMCITFLKVIRLNSIRVASILLIVAFFYDIFFVFITPMLFHGKSVMITVATSGGPPKADALWCEKYPDDKDCQGGNPMPMLLAVPKLFDFMGGSSLLGLGDIVLPGLLLSFAARLDAAKSLLGKLGGGRGSINSYNCPEQKYCGNCFFCKGGYFVPLVLSYAIGLAMANTAVYVMNMGQPALLYLVPCCLGTLSYIGWRRNELKDLWDGPRVLKAADDVLYSLGRHHRPEATSEHIPLPLDDGNDAVVVPSAQDNDDVDTNWSNNR